MKQRISRVAMTLVAALGLSLGGAVLVSGEAQACDGNCKCGSGEKKADKTAEADKLVPQPGAQVGDKTLCPVMGEVFEIGEDTPFVEHEGQKVFVCCPGCASGFAKDPAGFLAATNAKIEEANSAQ